MTRKINVLETNIKLNRLFHQSKTRPHNLQGVLTNQYLLLALIVVIAAALRFYKLGEWSFWIDEIYTLRDVSQLSEFSQIRLPINLILIGGSLDLFGLSEWSARLAPALIGTISLPLFYFFIRRLFDPLVGLISVLLLALSPWHIYWSQNARFYTLLLLFYVIGFFFFYLGVERKRWLLVFLSALFFFLAIRERLFSAFFIPVILSYLLARTIFLSERLSRSSFKYLLILLLPIVVLLFYDAYRVFLGGATSIIITFWQIFGGQSNQGPLRLTFALIYQIGIPLVCLGFFSGLKLINEKNYVGWYIFIGAIVPPVLLIIMSPIFFTVDRYVFITLPLWAILTAVALKELLILAKGNGIFLSMGVLITVLLFSSSQNFLYYEYQNGNRPDWKGAVELLRERQNEVDLITSTHPEMVNYYLDKNDVRSINSLSVEFLGNTNQRTWFLIDEATGWVEPELFKWIQANAQLINVRDVQIPGKSLKVITYLYNPANP